jgi:DNA-binding response OmpR family regulator
VRTRILLFEDDTSSALHGSPSSLDQQLPAKERLKELLDRIGELLGIAGERPATAPVEGEMVRRGEFALDLRTRRVTRGGELINVSPLEFALLYALIRRNGVVASRKDLMQEIWGPTAKIQPRAIDTHIARLRRKIEKTPTQPSYILTAVALGYRFAFAPEGETP